MMFILLVLTLVITVGAWAWVAVDLRRHGQALDRARPRLEADLSYWREVDATLPARAPGAPEVPRR